MTSLTSFIKLGGIKKKGVCLLLIELNTVIKSTFNPLKILLTVRSFKCLYRALSLR